MTHGCFQHRKTDKLVWEVDTLEQSIDREKIGRFISQERKRLKLTQRELADILEVSDKTISRWETGLGLPDMSLILPLCEALGITANELLSGERYGNE